MGRYSIRPETEVPVSGGIQALRWLKRRCHEPDRRAGSRLGYPHGNLNRVLVDRNEWTRLFGRPTSWSLVDHDATGVNQLAAPYSPRLSPLKSAFEASNCDRAFGADGLGSSDVDWLISEKEVGQGAVAVAAAGLGPIELVRVGNECPDAGVRRSESEVGDVVVDVSGVEL
jgi:hypothetical protein